MAAGVFWSRADKAGACVVATEIGTSRRWPLVLPPSCSCRNGSGWHACRACAWLLVRPGLAPCLSASQRGRVRCRVLLRWLVRGTWWPARTFIERWRSRSALPLCTVYSTVARHVACVPKLSWAFAICQCNYAKHTCRRVGHVDVAKSMSAHVHAHPSSLFVCIGRNLF